jgi:phage gp46-like protein
MQLDPSDETVDLVLDERGFIALTAGLETMVLVSLFTNRRARPSDKREQPFGWWGDTYAQPEGDKIGSLLWLLRRSPLSLETLRKTKLYVDQALAWMVQDGLAKTIVSTVERQDAGIIAIGVDITRPDGEPWSKVWEVHVNAL